MAEQVDAEDDSGSAAPDRSDVVPSDEYECKICCNSFDLDAHVPKVLGCSHTFCQECLTAVHAHEGRGWRVGCPVCRHRTPVPEHRLQNLPDNTDLTAALPLNKQEESPAERPAETSAGGDGAEESRCGQICRKVALAAGSVVATLSVLTMVALLLLGLILVQNYSDSTASVGIICLFVSSLFALFALIVTWVTCLLRYRPETEAGNISSTSSTRL